MVFCVTKRLSASDEGWKSMNSYSLSELSCFYGLRNPWTYRVPNLISRNMGTEIYKPTKPGLSRKNWDKWDS